MAATGPDSYTDVTTNELEEEDLVRLNHIWPAAFLAVSTLLLLIDEGELPDETPYLDLGMFDLVTESLEEETST